MNNLDFFFPGVVKEFTNGSLQYLGAATDGYDDAFDGWLFQTTETIELTEQLKHFGNSPKS